MTCVQVWKTFAAGGAPRLLLLMPNVNVDRLRHLFNTFDVMHAQVSMLFQALSL